MSYTTTLDGTTLQCRASLESEEELELYIKHLEKQKERMKPEESKCSPIESTAN